jgi:hypothetical protein
MNHQKEIGRASPSLTLYQLPNAGAISSKLASETGPISLRRRAAKARMLPLLCVRRRYTPGRWRPSTSSFTSM